MRIFVQTIFTRAQLQPYYLQCFGLREPFSGIVTMLDTLCTKQAILRKFCNAHDLAQTACIHITEHNDH